VKIPKQIGEELARKARKRQEMEATVQRWLGFGIAVIAVVGIVMHSCVSSQ
jgi:hypothetical protein